MRKILKLDVADATFGLMASLPKQAMILLKKDLEEALVNRVKALTLCDPKSFDESPLDEEEA